MSNLEPATLLSAQRQNCLMLVLISYNQIIVNLNSNNDRINSVSDNPSSRVLLLRNVYIYCHTYCNSQVRVALNSAFRVSVVDSNLIGVDSLFSMNESNTVILDSI